MISRITTTQYKNMMDALVTIGKTEGRPSLYRGMAATIAGAAPYTGLKFCTKHYPTGILAHSRGP